jgi:uroporphyrinogen-III decarboxylase
MFSDILTPLPAMGIDFTIVEGKGPKIANPIKSIEVVDFIHNTFYTPSSNLMYIRILII